MAEDNRAVADRMTEEVFRQGHTEVVEELVAEDFVEHNPMPGFGSDREGLKQFVTTLREAFPDFDIRIEDQLADGDKVVTRLTWRGTHTGEYSGLPPTGRRVEVQALTVFHFRDGKVFQNWTVIDQFGLFRQLGALPPRLLPAQLPASEK
jgi:steroid delta-isomerase-like uncharacterized protein